MKLDYDILSSLPKIELHLHLDCSLSYNVVKKLRPQILEKEYQEKFIAPEKCINLADFLKCAVSGIELMQTENELREVVKDLFAQLKRENIIYAEIRFAPLQHLDKGLKAEEVVEIVAETLRECINLTGIKAGIILCTLRHFNENQSLQTVKLVEQFKGNAAVVGFDIAADEAGYSVDAHKKAFEDAIKKDLPRTAHAGEARGADSMWETLKYFSPQRIGHGVRSIEDKELIELLVKRKIHLEICPTCNIQTNVFNEYRDHPINILYNSGVSVGINTDARSLVNISLTSEYMKLVNIFGWGIKHFYDCNINALSSAFISSSNKEQLERVLNSRYEI
jgi:adenosine deaminase